MEIKELSKKEYINKMGEAVEVWQKKVDKLALRLAERYLEDLKDIRFYKALNKTSKLRWLSREERYDLASTREHYLR